MMTLKQLRSAFKERAERLGLQVQCPMDGNIAAEVAIVAEAPGGREVEGGLPLIGQSGQLLFRTLAKHNLQRTKVYITNVMKRRQDQVKGNKPRANIPELGHWMSLLKWELRQLPHLRYILICGNYALEALANESGITKWRGSVIEVRIGDRVVTGICCNNPAAVIREPKTEVTFLMDVAKLPKVMNGAYHPHAIKHHINPTLDEAVDWIRMMRSDGIPVAWDIETPGNALGCIGLANNSHEGMCINLRDARHNRFSIKEEMTLWREFQSFFGDENVRLVAQNGSFDIYYAWFQNRIKAHRNWFDTLLAHHTLYPQLPHNLGFLTSQYTTHPYYKDDKNAWKESGNIDEYWEYNVKDCCITLAVQQKELVELRKQGLEAFFFDHVMHLQSHLALMTVGGIKTDLEAKERIRSTLAVDLENIKTDLRNKIAEATGDPDYAENINLNSNPQLRELFFTRLRLVGRGLQVDAANRERMRNHPRTSKAARAVIDALDLYAKEHKFYSTYAESRIDTDGRMRCEYKQYGTQTAPGRLSSTGVMWGTGTNLQNQPERAQEMYIADPDYVLVYFDLAQAEARVVGWRAEIEKWIEQFERARLEGGYDCHRALAAEMFEVAYDEVPAFDRYDVARGYHPPEGVDDRAPTLRFVSKRCRHGLNYRMMAAGLAEATGLPMSLAMEAFVKYHRTTPELKRWWAVEERNVRKTKRQYNAFGRRNIILERITDEAMESIIAFYPQSTVGDHVSKVVYQSHEDEKWPSHCRIALNVHDALIALCRKDQAMCAARVMKEYAEAPIPIEGIFTKEIRELIIPADFKFSQPDEQGIHRWSTLATMELEA